MPASHRFLKLRARELRRNMTDAEQHLWRWIRRKRFPGVQFYRQRPLAGFIVDFVAPSVSLVIEVDGGHHYHGIQAARDAQRDETLAALGFQVLRFSDREVLLETRGVLEAISLAIEQHEHRGMQRERDIPPAPAAPAPFREGGD